MCVMLDRSTTTPSDWSRQTTNKRCRMSLVCLSARLFFGSCCCCCCCCCSGFLRRSAESVWKDLEGAVPGIPVRIPILQDHSLDPFGEALGAFGRILKALFHECLFSTIPVRIPILQDRSLPPSREALGAIGRNLRGDGGSFGRTGSFHGSCSRNPRFQRSQEESLAPPPPFPSVCVCVCVCVGFVVLIE